MYGIENAEFEWVDTVRYMGINHAIPPSSESVTCEACHTPGGVMAWDALGYEKDPYPMTVEEVIEAGENTQESGR
jgi:hypothetical protein